MSLDIANAFNTLPHECIEAALKFHEVPLYLCALVRDYLRERKVLYEYAEGRVQSWTVTVGVPQGSVLGPLLWNLGYNWVLRGALLPRMDVVCFADDTLVAARARDWEEAVHLASVGTSLVVRRIRLLGLEVALEKTRSMTFYAPRRRTPPGLRIRVEGVRVPVEVHIKDLVAALGGGRLSLATMVRAMVESESAWEAAASFCETVLMQKEAAEREREEDVPLPSGVDGWGEEGGGRTPVFFSPRV